MVDVASEHKEQRGKDIARGIENLANCKWERRISKSVESPSGGGERTGSCRHDIVVANIIRDLPPDKRHNEEGKVRHSCVDASLDAEAVVLSGMPTHRVCNWCYRLDVKAKNVVEVGRQAGQEGVKAPVLACVVDDERPDAG